MGDRLEECAWKMPQEVSGSFRLELWVFLVSQYFLCFLSRMCCPFSEQFAIESGKAVSAWSPSVSRQLCLISCALCSLSLLPGFSRFLGFRMHEGSEYPEGSQEPVVIL